MHPGIELILGPNLGTQKSTDVESSQHHVFKGNFHDELSQASSKLNALTKGAELGSKKFSDQSGSQASPESDPNSPHETHQAESNGQEVPALMAHEKSNDIGRLILTTEQPKVSPASLRDFMSAQYVSSQGSERSPTTKNATSSVNPLGESPKAVHQNTQVPVAPDRAIPSESFLQSIRNDSSNLSKAAAARGLVESSLHSGRKATPYQPSSPTYKDAPLKNLSLGSESKPSTADLTNAIDGTQRRQRKVEAGTVKEQAASQTSPRNQGETKGLVPLAQHEARTESTLQKRFETLTSARRSEMKAQDKPIEILDRRYEIKAQDRPIDTIAPDKLANPNPTFGKSSNSGGHSGNQLSNLGPSIDTNTFLGEDPGNFDEALTEARGASRSSIELVRNATSITNTSATYQGLIQKLGEAVANRLSAAVSQENWNFQIRVKPAELGTIDVSIDYRDNGFEAKVTADESSTRALLQDSLAKLRMSLKETLDSSQNVDVYIGQNSKNQEEQSRDEERTNDGSVDLDLTIEMDLVHQELTPTKASSDRIDVMV